MRNVVYKDNAAIIDALMKNRHVVLHAPCTTSNIKCKIHARLKISHLLFLINIFIL